MTLKNEYFFDISKAIISIISNDIDLKTYCTDNIGGTLNIIENAPPRRKAEDPIYPLCIVQKGIKHGFENKEVASRDEKENYEFEVSFTGDFSLDNNSDYPTGVKTEASGIETWNPTDIMLRIAQRVQEQVEKEMDCEVPGILLGSHSVMADEYFSEHSEDGVVTSALHLIFYRDNRF